MRKNKVNMQVFKNRPEHLPVVSLNGLYSVTNLGRSKYDLLKMLMH